MRSPETPVFYLLDKEWRSLLASRSWWLLWLLMGPLTGLSFIGAVRTYAEVSGLNGTAEGVGEALSPLIGVWGPTFSACELAAVFLLPFAAIRTASADKQSGALKLELQQRSLPFATRIGVKAVAALAGWMIAMLPIAIAIALWRSYGGHLWVPELLAVTFGHVLNAGFTIALAFAAASLASHPSSAAILTLAVTVGTWIINFFASLQGGLWERAAAFTPAVVVGDFQHGLVRLDAACIGLLLTLAGLGIAAIWQRIGLPATRRMAESAATLLLFSVLAGVTGTAIRANWDVSENRGNSFPKADELALAAIPGRLDIVAHLAPEDSRRADLERKAFSKLRRVLRDVHIEYKSATSVGLFEQTREGYGEVEYRYQGRREVSLAATEEGVLEAIYTVTGVEPRKDVQDAVFRGHPLAVPPSGAPAIFYGLWPVLIAICFWWQHRKPNF